MKNVMFKINEANASKLINPRYTIRTNHADEIYHHEKDAKSLILNSFTFGYLQGVKATKAEMKRNAKK